MTDCSTTTIVVPAVVDLADLVAQLRDDRRRQTERELVDEQHLRLGHERHRQRQLLLFATREVASHLRAALTQDREQRHHLLACG